MKILFLPGLLCTNEIWGPLNTLRDHFECIDADVNKHNSIQEMGDELVELIAKKALKNIVIIGISMGGYIGLNIALRNLPQVQQVILINTSSRSVNVDTIPGRLEMIEKTRDGRFSEAIEESKGFCFFRPSPETDALEVRMGVAIGPHAYIKQQEAIISRKDVTEQLHGIDVPTLIITGKNDPVLPVSDSYKMLEAIEDSKLIAYSNCGHLATLEGDGIYNDVMNFINKV